MVLALYMFKNLTISRVEKAFSHESRHFLFFCYLKVLCKLEFINSIYPLLTVWAIFELTLVLKTLPTLN